MKTYLIYERTPMCPKCRENEGKKLHRVGATGRRLRCTGLGCGHEWDEYPIAVQERDEQGKAFVRPIR